MENPTRGLHFRVRGVQFEALWLIALVVVLFLEFAIPHSFVGGAQPKRTSTRVARSQALQSIPFGLLTGEVQTKLRQVVSKPSLYRRLPVKTIDCDPDLFVFVLRKPEVIVHIWKLMGVTSIAAERTGPYTMKTADGSGTKSNIDLVFGSRDTHVFYADIVYEGGLFAKPLTGRCVLVLKSDYHTTDTNRSLVTSRLDMFLQFDQIGADLLAKTLHPLVGKAADHNYVESLNFVRRVSHLAESNGPGMRKLVDRLEDLDPEIRNQFIRTASRVSSKAMANVAANPQAALQTPGVQVEPRIINAQDE